MTTRVLVCGSRDWTDVETIRRAMLAVPPPAFFLHGDGPTGADRICDQLCVEYEFGYQPFHAYWDRHGKAAGPLRNQRMIDEGKPDLVLAFPLPGSVGTWDCVRRARAAGIEVRVYGGDDKA